jgi:hypothetical protein
MITAHLLVALDCIWGAFGIYQFLSALRPSKNTIEEPPLN